ncbi:MAG TPA: hypothetical protein VLD37_02165 [Candidatus Bilamarchaeum sp.]|nr:hypothetical protein [Candidatus Bilamarchaeum sp.]
MKLTYAGAAIIAVTGAVALRSCTQYVPEPRPPATERPEPAVPKESPPRREPKETPDGGAPRERPSPGNPLHEELQTRLAMR